MEKVYNFKVAKLPAIAVVRACIGGKTNGLLKTVVYFNTNKILGCTLFCVVTNEMINTIPFAMNCGLGYQLFKDAIYTHPFMTEAFNDLYSLI